MYLIKKQISKPYDLHKISMRCMYFKNKLNNKYFYKYQSKKMKKQIRIKKKLIYICFYFLSIRYLFFNFHTVSKFFLINLFKNIYI